MASARRWRVAPTAAHHAEELAELQRLVFPTLDPSERFAADHYRRHVEMFPQGQFVALTREDKPVAATTTLRLNLDLSRPQHRFPEFLGGLFLTAHDPAGEWLYGADVGVHPDWRRQEFACALHSRPAAASSLPRPMSPLPSPRTARPPVPPRLAAHSRRLPFRPPSHACLPAFPHSVPSPHRTCTPSPYP